LIETKYGHNWGKQLTDERFLNYVEFANDGPGRGRGLFCFPEGWRNSIRPCQLIDALGMDGSGGGGNSQRRRQNGGKKKELKEGMGIGRG
jgi:hypothetical protein